MQMLRTGKLISKKDKLFFFLQIFFNLFSIFDVYKIYVEAPKEHNPSTLGLLKRTPLKILKNDGSKPSQIGPLETPFNITHGLKNSVISSKTSCSLIPIKPDCTAFQQLISCLTHIFFSDFTCVWLSLVSSLLG